MAPELVIFVLHRVTFCAQSVMYQSIHFLLLLKVPCVKRKSLRSYITKLIWLTAEFFVNRGKDRRRIAYYASLALTKSNGKLVGLGRLELPTSPLSGVRSNQLSYRPVERCLMGMSARPLSGPSTANVSINQAINVSTRTRVLRITVYI